MNELKSVEHKRKRALHGYSAGVLVIGLGLRLGLGFRVRVGLGQG